MKFITPNLVKNEILFLEYFKNTAPSYFRGLSALNLLDSVNSTPKLLLSESECSYSDGI